MLLQMRVLGTKCLKMCSCVERHINATEEDWYTVKRSRFPVTPIEINHTRHDTNNRHLTLSYCSPVYHYNKTLNCFVANTSEDPLIEHGNI